MTMMKYGVVCVEGKRRSGKRSQVKRGKCVVEGVVALFEPTHIIKPKATLKNILNPLFLLRVNWLELDTMATTTSAD